MSSPARLPDRPTSAPILVRRTTPPREKFKTKADVVQFVQGAVAAGAKVIQEQGDAGLDKTTIWGKRLVHDSYLWTFATEHSGEYYRQLVVYTNSVEQKNRAALAESIWKSFQSGDENANVAADELATYIFQAIKNIGEMPLNLLLQGHLNFPEIYGLKKAV